MKLKYKIKQIIKNNKILYMPIKTMHKVERKKKMKLLQNEGYNTNEILKKELTKNEIKYISLFGTLLGIIRENGFIAHDDDIDYGVFISTLDEWKKLYNVMLGIDAKFKHFFVRENNITEMSFICNGIVVDFFNITDYSNEMQKIYWYYRNPKKYYEGEEVSTGYTLVHKIANITEKKIKDTVFYIPKNYEEVVSDCYGPTWKTPIKDRTKCSTSKTRIEVDEDINYIKHEKDFIKMIES